MQEERRQARILVRHLDRLDAGVTEETCGVLEDFHRLGVDVLAPLRARMNEAFAGLIVARRAQEARCRGTLVPSLLRVAPARLDLVSHAGPFLEPGMVIPHALLER